MDPAVRDEAGRAVLFRGPGSLRGSVTLPRPAGGRSRPTPRVNIGVVVSIQSLFGFTDTPG